ncbi:hypothetical protein P389DRAFT_42803 [Cystobasidium minutum MCA 4210]|uniref:uncharacterized protein n=1 Tax=Cystobasidium minutum MCA 4210 TaxID=1397322 RepID=UPI0034CF25F6|eukprot:jgi/Rhomi1/42803/CE42802_652
MRPRLEGQPRTTTRKQRHHANTKSTTMTFELSTLSRLLLLLVIVSASISSTLAQAATGGSRAKNIPQIDYEALGGSLGIVGSFAGIGLYDVSGKSSYIASTSTASSSNNRTSSERGHLLSLDNEGTPSIIASVEGDIHTVIKCSSNNAVYFGGSFSAVNADIAASNVAVYFPANDSIIPLGSGVDGPVHALACDGDTLYVGGSFRQPVGAPSTAGYAGAVAAWNIGTSTWSPLGFGGFRGDNVDILSIAINDAAGTDKSILFGGSFEAYWLNDTTITSPTSVSVTTLANGTISITQSNTTSSISDNGSVEIYPSFGSSLIPISLASAEITSSASSSDSRYSDPSNVFCPAGEDGTSASTWLARQGDQSSRITARVFAPLDVGGFRIGNTRVNGAGAQTFRITALPSNQVLTLQYRQDPSSSSSALATCSESCPLSHDASVNYEDFLLASADSDGTTQMTGFEITILSHYGAVAGLHMLQLLSSGTVAYSIDTQNQGWGRGICTSGPASVYGRSSSTHQPTAQIPWDHVEVVSSTISGTSEGALCAAVPVDADSNTAPTATWYPYFGQDGNYELYFFTPACSFDATCGQRGAVDVEVAISGTAGSSTSMTTINQEGSQDQSTLIYSGPINPIANNAEVKVTMKLSSSERPNLAAGKGDKYYLVADKIITVAKDTDGNGSNQIKIGTGMNSVNVSTADSNRRQLRYDIGHGLFEWKTSEINGISPTLDTGMTTGQEIRTVQTAGTFDRLAFGLSASSKIEQIVALPDSAGFVLAGDMDTTASTGAIQNVVLLNADGRIGQNAQRGLNGPVNALTYDGQYIYAAGNFSATGDAGLSDFNGRARRKIAENWESVPGLSNDGEASFIAQLPNDKLVIGYQENAVDIWYSSNNSVATMGQPLIVASLSSSALSQDGKTAYLAGSLSALVQSTSSGSARITKDGLEPINFGFQAASPSQTGATPSSTPASKRSLASTGLMSTLKNKLKKRQSGNALAAPSALPTSILASSTEPVIYAGAHWKNSSSDQDVTILGGRFVSRDGLVTNLGVLRADGSLTPLQGDNAASGDVRSLLVADDLLWIGRANAQDDALTVYDLAAQQWRTSDFLSTAVAASSGHFENLNAVVGCNNICEWQKESKQWTALGSGVEGIAAAVALSKAHLYLAGSFVSNNTSAYVTSWDYESKVWNALPSEGLPGPTLAISVDSDSSIFVSGTSASDSSSYLSRWDGNAWAPVVGSQANAQDQDSLQLGGSDVQQLLLAPITSENDNDYFLKNDRVLMVSGQLNLARSGPASSAIFDGSAWYPYLLSTTASGAAGTIAGFFYPANTIQFGRHQHLALGLVILVSMAIALGVVFLGVLVALIITLSKRHDDANAYPPVVIPPYDADYAAREAKSPTPFVAGSFEKSKGKITPTPMLETINAATVALSAGHPGLATAGGVRILDDSHDSDEREPSSAGEQNDDTSSEENSIYDDPEEGDDSLPMRAVRYSFDAEREEELSINTRDMVEVLDESDEHWHIVRRLRDGRQGLVPSAFLT